MLVLSRHRDEVICIGEDIRIVVVAIRGDKVRLGIEAPRSVAVHRLEVKEAIEREAAEETADSLGPQRGPATLAQLVAQNRAVARETSGA